MATNKRFAEIFDLEMYAWWKGLEAYPGEMYPEFMHAVVRDLKDSFEDAIKHCYVFSPVILADRFAEATKYSVSPKEICFHMISQFPHPRDLTEDQQNAMAEIIDLVEQKYGGALDRLERRWRLEAKERAVA